MIGPERTRIWLAYLAGVSLAFSRGSLSLFQTLASKKTTRWHAMCPRAVWICIDKFRPIRENRIVAGAAGLS